MGTLDGNIQFEWQIGPFFVHFGQACEINNIFLHTIGALVSQTAIKSFGATSQDIGIDFKSKFGPKLVA